MKILTWNIGCFSYLKFAKYFNYSFKGIKINHEYFQPKLNSRFVSNFIEQQNPDIIFLQEIHDTKDIELLNILEKYPHKQLPNTWYHKHSILVASKIAFTAELKNDFNVVFCNNITYIPIHLNSFSALKRLEDCKKLSSICNYNEDIIILGDTNIWSRGRCFIFSNDKKAYYSIAKKLTDITKKILSTTFLGFNLDKVFVSNKIIVKNIESPKVRGYFMDHYPVVFEIEQ